MSITLKLSWYKFGWNIIILDVLIFLTLQIILAMICPPITWPNGQISLHEVYVATHMTLIVVTFYILTLHYGLI